jgi:hypothetical protein
MFSRNSIFLFFVLGLIAINAAIVFQTNLTDIKVIKNNPYLDEDLRFRLKIGSPLYEYLAFIDREIPKDAVVAIPPPGPAWPHSGSSLWMGYFLYPRKVVQNTTNTGVPPTEATHALLIWGEPGGLSQDEYLWPRIDLTDFEVIYLQKNPPWGIIKLHD